MYIYTIIQILVCMYVHICMYVVRLKLTSNQRPKNLKLPLLKPRGFDIFTVVCMEDRNDMYVCMYVFMFCLILVEAKISSLQ